MLKTLPDSLIEFLSTLKKESLQNLTESLKNSSKLLFPDAFETIIKKSGIIQANYFASQVISVNEFFDEASFLEASHQSDEIDPIVANLFIGIALNKKINFLSKVSELAFHHPDSLIESNIIVDARPIFDDSKEIVSSYAILTFLKLRFLRYNEPNLLSFHLDIKDIRKLKEQCENALKKVEVASKQLSRTVGQDVYIPGNNDMDL